jgi:hypothetical protein
VHDEGLSDGPSRDRRPTCPFARLLGRAQGQVDRSRSSSFARRCPASERDHSRIKRASRPKINRLLQLRVLTPKFFLSASRLTVFLPSRYVRCAGPSTKTHANEVGIRAPARVHHGGTLPAWSSGATRRRSETAPLGGRAASETSSLAKGRLKRDCIRPAREGSSARSAVDSEPEPIGGVGPRE